MLELARLARAPAARHDLGMLALIALLVFVSAAAIDFAEAKYVLAAGSRDARSAAAWSVVMWALGALGFVAVVQVSLWLMLPEGVGFYVGTRMALREPPRLPKAVMLRDRSRVAR